MKQQLIILLMLFIIYNVHSIYSVLNEEAHKKSIQQILDGRHMLEQVYELFGKRILLLFATASFFIIIHDVGVLLIFTLYHNIIQYEMIINIIICLLITTTVIHSVIIIYTNYKLIRSKDLINDIYKKFCNQPESAETVFVYIHYINLAAILISFLSIIIAT